MLVLILSAIAARYALGVSCGYILSSSCVTAVGVALYKPPMISKPAEEVEISIITRGTRHAHLVCSQPYVRRFGKLAMTAMAANHRCFFVSVALPISSAT